MSRRGAKLSDERPLANFNDADREVIRPLAPAGRTKVKGTLSARHLWQRENTFHPPRLALGIPTILAVRLIHDGRTSA